VPAITIELDDETFGRLQRRAAQTGTTIEQVVAEAAAAKLKQDVPDEEFDEIAERLIETYRPVLKRLAE
jgi:predicted transcriptional regulator